MADGKPKCGANPPSTCAGLTTLFAGCGLACSQIAVKYAYEFLIPGLDCALATKTPTNTPAKSTPQVTGQSLAGASKLCAKLASSLLVCIGIIALVRSVSY